MQKQSGDSHSRGNNRVHCVAFQDLFRHATMKFARQPPAAAADLSLLTTPRPRPPFVVFASNCCCDTPSAASIRRYSLPKCACQRRHCLLEQLQCGVCRRFHQYRCRRGPSTCITIRSHLADGYPLPWHTTALHCPRALRCQARIWAATPSCPGSPTCLP